MFLIRQAAISLGREVGQASLVGETLGGEGKIDNGQESDHGVN